MKEEKAKKNRLGIVLQIPITDDHINRLRRVRLVHWEPTDPLEAVAADVLAVALACPEAWSKISDSIMEDAKAAGMNYEDMLKKLLHRPKGHRIPWQCRYLTEAERQYCTAEGIDQRDYAIRKHEKNRQ